jgi:small subunit ribosomal protein S8
MSTTDPIADLLTRIRNGHSAAFTEVKLPASSIKIEILKIMEQEGYIEGFSVEEDKWQGTLNVQLKYGRDGAKTISGLERVSRPSRRVYCNKNDIPKVLNGLGINIVSTSRGVMTGGTCAKLGVGGEVLCNIW